MQGAGGQEREGRYYRRAYSMRIGRRTERRRTGRRRTRRFRTGNKRTERRSSGRRRTRIRRQKAGGQGEEDRVMEDR